MRVIEISQKSVELDALLEMACRETIILRQSGHKEFVLSSIDDFALEVELLRNNKEFMTYLDELSQEKATVSIEDVESMLADPL